MKERKERQRQRKKKQKEAVHPCLTSSSIDRDREELLSMPETWTNVQNLLQG